MAEYIDKTEIIKAIVAEASHCLVLDKPAEARGYIGAKELIERRKAADVAEVRHGRWIVHFDHFAPYQKCSVCGFEIPLVATENEVGMCFYKHCPECTARMDKEAEHETS